MIKSIARYIVVYLLLLVVFTGALMVTALLPNGRISYRVRYSAEYFQREGNRPKVFTYNGSSILDNYTDATMLNVVLNLDKNEPLKSALRGAKYKGTHVKGGIFSLLEATEEPYPEPNDSYSRYWHGYAVLLKPLLFFFSYPEIRLLNMYLFYGLLAFCLLYLYKKVGWQLPTVLLFTMVMLNITIIPMSLQFLCVFMIAFIAIVVMLEIYDKRPDLLPIAFFVLGAVTMYFDFYTYPILSYGFPMVSLLALLGKRKDSTLSAMLKLTLHCLITWFLGYILIWVGKIILAGIVLGDDEITVAINQFLFRMNREVPDMGRNKLWLKSIQSVLDEVLIRPISVILPVLFVLWIPLFSFFRRTMREQKTSLVLLVVALIPLVWFAVAVNPIAIHCWFQHRGIGLTIVSVMYAFVYSIDERKVKTFLCKMRDKRKVVKATLK